MKLFMLLILPLAFQTVFAGTVTSGTRGGGDLCENRIKIIKDDLLDWISKGGPNNLKLPSGIVVGQYKNDMMNVLSTAAVECVGKGDRGYPVEINGVPKVCVFDSGRNNIICDYTKFTSTKESDQYVLIHHEYAGLANIEIPNASDSNYSVSNQISGYLVDQVIKKLAVKPRGQTDDSIDRSLTLIEGQITNMGTMYDKVQCNLRGKLGVDYNTTNDGFKCLKNNCYYNPNVLGKVFINDFVYNFKLNVNTNGSYYDKYFSGELTHQKCKDEMDFLSKYNSYAEDTLDELNLINNGTVEVVKIKNETICRKSILVLIYDNKSKEIRTMSFRWNRVKCPIE